jgi:hypothetical protein
MEIEKIEKHFKVEIEKLLALKITNEQWRLKPLMSHSGSAKPEDQGHGHFEFR